MLLLSIVLISAQFLRQANEQGYIGEGKVVSNKNATYLFYQLVCPASHQISASIVSWSKEDREATNVKIWKLLTMYGGFHTESNIYHQRLYTIHRESRQGLMSVKAVVLRAFRSTSLRQDPNMNVERMPGTTADVGWRSNRVSALARQDSAWNVLLTCVWHWEILPMVGKGWIKRQYWSTDPNSTRTGTKHHLYRSRDLVKTRSSDRGSGISSIRKDTVKVPGPKEWVWKLKAKVGPVVVAALKAVIPKLEE